MKRNRGSALVTTLIFGTVMATLAGSYIHATLNTRNMSDRSFNTNAAVSIAEAGVEAGLWAYNNGNWTDWEDLDSTKKKITLARFKNTHMGGGAGNTIDLDRGVNADATIVVYDYAGANPRIVVRAQVWNTRNRPKTEVQRWLETNLRKRSYFATGLVGKDSITFSGNNASVDAYDSRLGTYDQALATGGNNRYDRGSIATVAINSTIDVINADIWGTASIGSSDIDDINVGPQGRIGPYGTALNVRHPDYVSTDFRAELPDVIAPSTSGSLAVPTTPSIALTGSADPENPTVYSTAAIAISGGSDQLSVTGHVVLICTGVSITGGSTQLSIATNSSLKVYCSGNFVVAGSGIGNADADPAALQIYGTAPTGYTQSVAVKGNGSLAAAVYAPNAEITINGNGNTFGSFVGKSVRLTGNAFFHYDIALNDVTTDQPATIRLWRELLDPSTWPTADFN